MMGWAAIWMAVGVLAATLIRVIVDTFRDTRPWPVERATKLPNAKQLRRSRLELTKRLTNRTVAR